MIPIKVKLLDWDVVVRCRPGREVSRGGVDQAMLSRAERVEGTIVEFAQCVRAVAGNLSRGP